MSSNWNVACLRVSVLVLYCLGSIRVSSLRLSRLICLKFTVTKVYIYFSRNLKSDLLLEKAWKIAYRIFVWGCWMTILNWMTTKLDFSFLAHHNSLKRSTSLVSARVGLIFLFVQHTTHQELSITNVNRSTHSCSRLDYCNRLLYGLFDSSLNKLQRGHYRKFVQDWFFFNEHKFCHVTPHTMQLLWLLVRFRIEFNFFFKILYGLAPSYLSYLISRRRPSRYNLRNSKDNLLLSYPSFISKLTLGDRSFTCALQCSGMLCHSMSDAPS